MRLSYSGDKLLACPREYQLSKLKNTGYESDYGQSGHTMYGHCFGAGAEVLLQGGSVDEALWVAFTGWDHKLEVAPKYLQVLMTSLIKLKEEFPFEEYSPLRLGNGKLAMEVGGKLWLDAKGEEDYYVLFTDAIVLHIPTGRPVVVEIKHTKQAGDIAPLYVNSPQAVLYSLMLPYLFPQYKEHAWETLYLVNQITNVWDPKIIALNIQRRYDERLSALMGVMLHYERVKRMQELNFFPKALDNQCLKFGRVCRFFGQCDELAMTSEDKPNEVQNLMDDEREARVVVELHLQTLLNDEYSRKGSPE